MSDVEVKIGADIGELEAKSKEAAADVATLQAPVDALKTAADAAAASAANCTRALDGMATATKAEGSAATATSQAILGLADSTKASAAAAQVVAQANRDAATARRNVTALIGDGAKAEGAAGKSAKELAANTGFMAKNFGLAGHEAKNFGFQMNDVVGGLLTGQLPFYVLMQQGPQIAQIFGDKPGGVGGAFKTLLGLISPTAWAVTGLGAALGATLIAGFQFSGAMEALQRATLGAGQAAGATVAELDQIATAAGKAGGVSAAAAREMEVSFLGTGRIGKSLFGELIGVARDYEIAMGVDATRATKDLGAAMADPKRGADALNQSLNFLDASTIKLIGSLQDQGRLLEAQQILLTNLKTRLDGASESVSGFARSWHQVSLDAAAAWEWLGRLSGAAPKSIEALKAQRARIAAAGGGQYNTDLLASIDAQIGKLEAVGTHAGEAAVNLQSQAIAVAGAALDPKKAQIDVIRNNIETLTTALKDNTTNWAKVGMTAAEAQAKIVRGNADIAKLLKPDAIPKVKKPKAEKEVDETELFLQRVARMQQGTSAVARQALSAAKADQRDFTSTMISGVRARTDAAVSEAQTDAELARIGLDQRLANIDALNRMGLISDAQAAEQKQAAADLSYQIEASRESREYALKAEGLRAELALLGERTAEAGRVNAELERLAVEHEGRMRIISTEAAGSKVVGDLNKEVRAVNVVQPWAAQVTGMVTNWATGIATMREGWNGFGRFILQKVTAWAAQKLAIWVAGELGMTAATAAGATTRVATEAAAAATTTAITGTSALAQIGAHAAVAAAGAWAAISSIPIIGPVLAPLAAAAALAGVVALGAKIFSARGGEESVPYDGAIYRLHAEETVLPATIAKPLRGLVSRLASNGGATAAGMAEGVQGAVDRAASMPREGDMHLHVSALDAKSVRRLFQANGDALGDVMRRQMRELKGG